MSIDATLTQAEREAPFTITAPDGEGPSGPTRTALEIIEAGALLWLTERDPQSFALLAVTAKVRGER